MNDRSVLHNNGRLAHWLWAGCVICCVVLGSTAAWNAQRSPHRLSPAALPAAAQPHRSTVESDPNGVAYRWLGTQYPLPVAGVSGTTVVHLRIWTAHDVSSAALSTPHGLLPLPVAQLVPGRSVAFLLMGTPWWQLPILQVAAAPSHDPHAVVAYAGMTTRSTGAGSILVGGWWVLALAACGWLRAGVRGAAGAALLAAAALWCWPALVMWVPAASLCATVAAGAGMWPTLRRHTPWLWAATLAATAASGVARMARRPSDFAELHWLLNYDAGFVKRGLIGSLLPPSWQSESGIWWLSAAILVLAMVGHAASVWWVLTRTSRDPVVLLTALVVACSPAALMQGFLIGYYDALVVLGVLIGFWQIRPGRVTPAWVGILWAVLVLIHESTILFVAAWALVTVALTWADTPAGSTRRTTIARTLWVVALPVLVLGVVVAAQRIQSIPLLHAAILERAAAAPFATRDSSYDVARQVADWTVMPFSAHYAKYHGLFWQRIASRESWVVLPTLATIWLCAALIWGARPGRYLVLGAVIGATALPVGLDVIAVDTGRIASYSIVIGWYALVWLLRASPEACTAVQRDWFWVMTLPIVVWNSLVQPFWLVPYDLHAALPVPFWVILLPAVLPFAWAVGSRWLIRHRAPVTAL